MIPHEKEMNASNFYTFEEITGQTTGWAEAIERVSAHAPEILQLDLAAHQQVICTGCGSTYYLALSAAALLQARTGVISRAFPASELLFSPQSTYTRGKAILVAISRSGATTETVKAVEAFRSQQRGKVVVITNYADSPLAALGDVVLAMPIAQERSVAQTRSFASMHVAVAALADLLDADASRESYADALIESGERLLRDHADLAGDLAANEQIEQVFFLGSGARYGLACEASLKLKEMSQTVSEPFHFLEFRHGPISMVDANTLVIGLVSEAQRDRELEVLDQVRSYGGRTLTIGENGTDIAFGSGIAAHLRNVLYLPVLQLFAYHRSVAKGKNPDSPRNLAQYIELNLDI